MDDYPRLFFIVTIVLAGKRSDTLDSHIAKAKIDGKRYKAFLSDDLSIVITNSRGLNILTLKETDLFIKYEGFESFKFVDFNNDGYKDLLIRYLSNVPERLDLILYDKKSHGFKLVKNFPDFPCPVNLPGTNMYYSYHRNGCADLDWVSDLFRIVNYKIVKLGTIYGRGCGDYKINEGGVFVYKFKGKGKALVKRFPIQVINTFKNTKWGFINRYWKHHYAVFLS